MAYAAPRVPDHPVVKPSRELPPHLAAVALGVWEPGEVWELSITTKASGDRGVRDPKRTARGVPCRTVNPRPNGTFLLIVDSWSVTDAWTVTPPPTGVNMRTPRLLSPIALALIAVVGCSSDDDKNAKATVQIMNDFNNTEMAYQPPWTICESSYLGVEFGKLELGETSDAKSVAPGLDYVLMVAAWDDPTCAAENALPIASKNEEEVVDGQTRTIAINMANHQGPCPPNEGVVPIPKAQYNRILELWPDYDFTAYAARTENTQCVPSDAGAAGAGGTGDDAGGSGGAAGAG